MSQNLTQDLKNRKCKSWHALSIRDVNRNITTHKLWKEDYYKSGSVPKKSAKRTYKLHLMLAHTHICTRVHTHTQSIPLHHNTLAFWKFNHSGSQAVSEDSILHYSLKSQESVWWDSEDSLLDRIYLLCNGVQHDALPISWFLTAQRW